MKTENITISSSEKLSIIANLSTMISAGIPILEVIDSLLEDTKGNKRKILETVHEDLIQGKHLYASFDRFPKIFDKVTVNVIKGSEEAGALDVVLKDLKAQIKKEMEFNGKIKSAMAYPMLIGVVFVGVLLLMLTAVVPKIAVVFEQLHAQLPLPTRFFIFLSNSLLHYPLQIFAVIGILGTGIFFLFKKKRTLILIAFYHLPLISRMVKEIDLTRFSRSLYLLLASGITITTALELTKNVVVKPDIREAVSYAKEMVLAGKELSVAFKERKTFPAIMIKIIQAGEKTGSLDKSLQDISETLDYQVSETLKLVTLLVEPLMLVLIGIVIGGMMFSILIPIYNLVGTIR